MVVVCTRFGTLALMRGALPLLACAILGSCSTTTFAEPRVLVSPYLAVYQLRGETSMQSQPVVPGPIQDNPPQSLKDFGQEHHDEDLGIKIDVGDGFAGVRLDYYKLDMFSSRKGIIDGDWGNLQATDLVRMKFEMDEFRLGYLENVYSKETEWRGAPLTLRVAAGGVLSHRSMVMRGRTDDGLRTQNAYPEGDNFYPAARVRAQWRDFTVDAEYAISPGLALGGDFTDTLQDMEFRLSYAVPLRDVTFFAGYRYSTLPVEGNSGSFHYDADLILDGYQFGVQVAF